MTDVPLHMRAGATIEERCASAIAETSSATIEEIKKAAFPHRNVKELQKLQDALDELYSHALATDKTALRMFCLFLYLDVRKRCLQVGLG